MQNENGEIEQEETVTASIARDYTLRSWGRVGGKVVMARHLNVLILGCVK